MIRLEDLWWREQEPFWARLLLAPLLPAEALFRAGAALRNTCFERGLATRTRAAAPVISVGNLTVGGAGKTPAVLALAARLLRDGRRPAILSRGYGAGRSDPRVVSRGEGALLSAAEAGDEPVLLARRLPGAAVLCGPRRAELAARAVGLGADVLLLDDGFQHRALHRDLDLVVIDAVNPRGNGHLLPCGPNREPMAALRRAGLVWLSHADAAAPDALARLRDLALAATGRPPIEACHAVSDVLSADLERSFGPESLRGSRVLLLCGLARPDGFRRTMAGLGAAVAAERIYRDHHLFTPVEVEEAIRAARAAGCEGVVTTEKDAVRLPAPVQGEEKIRVVRIEARLLAGGESLDRALEPLLSPSAGRAGRAGTGGRESGGACFVS